MSLALRAALLAEAERLGFPFCSYAGGSSHLAGEASWRGALPNILPGDLAVVEAALRAHGAEHARHVAVEAGRPWSSDRELVVDPALAAEARREAEEDLARHVAERPERIEALLARAVSSLDAIAERLAKK